MISQRTHEKLEKIMSNEIETIPIVFKEPKKLPKWKRTALVISSTKEIFLPIYNNKMLLNFMVDGAKIIQRKKGQQAWAESSFWQKEMSKEEDLKEYIPTFIDRLKDIIATDAIF